MTHDLVQRCAGALVYVRSRWTRGECRLVSVPAQKGYYANDSRKTRRGNSATGKRPEDRNVKGEEGSQGEAGT